MIEIPPIFPQTNQHVQKTQVADKDSHNRNKQEKKPSSEQENKKEETEHNQFKSNHSGHLDIEA